MIEDDTDGISNNHGNGDMLVYYSLGNFISWTSSTGKDISNRVVGGMAMETLSLPEGGESYVSDYGVKALVCHLENKHNGITVYPLSDYTEELSKKNRISSQDSGFSLKYCENLCNKVWENLWK